SLSAASIDYQIVGRERRERVSQLAWCGGGCFDSRRRVNSNVGGRSFNASVNYGFHGVCMSSSIKCPHCGLVQFSTGGTCKRCKNDVGVDADFSSHMPPRSGRGAVRGRTHPLMSWFITLVLVITNSALGYVVAERSEAVGLVVSR